MSQPSDALPQAATKMRLTPQDLYERTHPTKEDGLVAVLYGAKGSGVARQVALVGSVAPDYIVLEYGSDGASERVWARSRQASGTIEYHLAADSNTGFPTHSHEIR